MTAERSEGALVARQPWTKPTRVAIYARTAIENLEGLALQESIVRKYVEEKGGTVVGVYQDCGFTGTTLARPDWERLAADAGAGKFDAVVTDRLSRLGRGETASRAVERLSECSIAVETFHDGPIAMGGLQWELSRLLDQVISRIQMEPKGDQDEGE